jgi:stage II sporulation protein AA (anti-sigma F factor antagonist)
MGHEVDDGYHAESSRHGPVGYVRLFGELDSHVAEELAATFGAVFSERPLDQVVVDLRGASFVDSTILGVLVATWKHALRLDVRLVFVKGPPAVHRPFEKTHIADHLTFVQL